MNVNHLSIASWNPDIINNEPKLYFGCIWGKAHLPLCLSEAVSKKVKSKAVLFLISANKCSRLPSSVQPLRLLGFPWAHTLTSGTMASLLPTQASNTRPSSQVITCVHLPSQPSDAEQRHHWLWACILCQESPLLRGYVSLFLHTAKGQVNTPQTSLATCMIIL